MKNEIWKPIPGYEGFYEASNTGRIKSCSRVVNHNTCSKITIQEKILKPINDGNGYFKVRLYKNSEYKIYKVHRLVLFAFCGINFMTCDHIDGNRQNNDISNLRYCTQKQNNIYSRLRLKKSSQYIGVSYCKWTNKWKAVININGKSKTIGRFKDEIEASEAYQSQLNLIQ